jgi:spoIIIJ-associated protein
MVGTTNQQQNNVKNIISTLLSHLKIQGAVAEGQLFDTPFFIIETDEAPLLIGERGQNLEALSYLVRRIAERGTHPSDERQRFVIDVNSYTKKHFEDLRDRALMGAERVKYFKKEVTLQPMTAIERRIVHLTLQDCPGIATESVGSGTQRRVVIKLANDVSQEIVSHVKT